MHAWQMGALVETVWIGDKGLRDTPGRKSLQIEN